MPPATRMLRILPVTRGLARTDDPAMVADGAYHERDFFKRLMGYHSLPSDYWTLVTGHWSPVTGHWTPVTGHWTLVAGPCRQIFSVNGEVVFARDRQQSLGDLRLIRAAG